MIADFCSISRILISISCYNSTISPWFLIICWSRLTIKMALEYISSKSAPLSLSSNLCWVTFICTVYFNKFSSSSWISSVFCRVIWSISDYISAISSSFSFICTTMSWICARHLYWFISSIFIIISFLVWLNILIHVSFCSAKYFSRSSPFTRDWSIDCFKSEIFLV